MARPPTILALSKIRVPPHPRTFIRRPRLVDHLRAQVEKRLLLISAPAGYGKTSLLADWAERADSPVAWYTLDEFDNSPHTFLAYLIEAIRVPLPDFGTSARATLERATETPTALQAVVAQIANEVSRLPAHLVVVLDDYHAIQNPTIDHLVAQFIRYAGERGHLFISSRTVPRLPDQALWMARGQMARLGVAELRFTVPEIQALIQQNFGVALSEPRAQDLARRSEGWITALVLMAHRAHAQQWVEQALPPMSECVFDYLTEQVFASQPEPLRHFMLGSSVWHPLSADALDRLPDVSESQRHLQRLVEQNLFVSALSGEEETYGYHPLFREFLRTRLARQDPMWYAQLRLASARLYAEQARWERAVEAFLALERYDEAIETLARAEDSLRKLSEIATVAPWLERIPVTLSQMGPHLLALQGKLHLARGEPARAIPLFEQAIAAFECAGDYAAAADKAVWKGTALRFLGRYPECLAECERIQRWVTCLPAEHPASTRLRAAGLHLGGVAQWHLGDLAHADTALNQARALFDATDDCVSRANVYHDLGMVARARGELPAALDAYRVALALWEQMGYRDSAAQTLNNLGYLHLLRGEMQEAERVLQDALQRARQGGGGRTEAAVLATLGDLSREQGEWTHALEFYRESLSVAEEVQDAHLVFYARVALGDTYRLMREWTSAREWLDAAAACADTAARVERGQLALAEGALASDQGRLDAAMTWIHQAAADFRQAGNKHLETLAEYRLADLMYARGHPAQAQAHLMRTAELIEMLGYDHFLVVEGRHTLATLRLASTLPGVGQRFKRIFERVHPVPPPAGASRRVTATAPKVAVYTLGQEQFIVRGKAVTRLRPQVREVFLYLLVRAPTEVRKEELTELFWPHLSAERANGVLRITLTRLRQALGVVVTTNGGYALDTESLWYDVREFERGLRAARQTPSVRVRITRLKQTLELYRGDYLERLEAYWVLAERARLRQMYLDALMNLAEAYGEMAEWEAARETFQRAAQVEPFLEAAWAGAMKMYLRLGNRMAALAQYAELEQLLRDEMGLDPSPELQTLYHDINALRV